ncbi:MAG: immunoglobulin-like domain-containing protein [Bacteroidota bacterium]
MKKVSILIATAAFIGGVFFVSSCKKDDTGNPVVSLKNDDAAHNRVTQFSAATYTDPGATATDDTDGNLTPTVSGSVNMGSAGEYTLTYTATDAAGNKTDAVRKVTVDGALYIASYTYTATDYPDGGVTGTPWQETITPSSVTNNKINFQRFADYNNGIAYGTIAGVVITIPTQTVTCGTTPVARQFSGSATFSSGFTSFTINYTEVTNGTTATGHTTYVKN